MYLPYYYLFGTITGMIGLVSEPVSLKLTIVFASRINVKLISVNDIILLIYKGM